MAEKHSPLHQFEIHPIGNFALGGYDLSFSNASLFMVAALLSISAFLILGMRRGALVPGRWQAMSEMSYQFIAGMIGENIGPEGKKFFPFIFSLFMFILFANLLGMLPFSFTTTSHIAVTFALALTVFLTVMIYGFVKHGLHFFSLFAPSGVPKVMLVLLVPIEMISFLAAAMTAGHVLLKVIAGFIVMFIAAFGIVPGIAAGVVPLVFLIAVIALEIFICFLQAYIFSLLTSIYLNDAVNLH